MNPPFRSLNLFLYAHWLLLGLIFTLMMSFWFGSNLLKKDIADIYNDQRRLNALKTFEQAIVTISAATVSSPITLERLQQKFPCADADMLVRLNSRLQLLSSKLQALSLPDKNLRINLDQWSFENTNCLDVLEITKWLAENQEQLDNMDWSGLWGNKTNRPPLHVPQSIFQQTNPWRGADGCVYIGPLIDQRLLYWHERYSNKEACTVMAPREIDRTKIVAIERKKGAWAKDDLAWVLPDDLATILADLNRIRAPEGITYGIYTQVPESSEAGIPETDKPQPHGPNRIHLHGRETDVGFNVFLTIDPKTQTLAQQWAHCYTGDPHACAILGVDNAKLSGEFYETASVRMAAIVVLDVTSGKIEALGSAHTHCYKQDHDGPNHGSECPDTPFSPRYDPDRLLNHALFVDTLPASTIKPIMALGFLMDNTAYKEEHAREALWLDLKKSNSASFLDRLFCGRDVNGQTFQSELCQRPQRVQDSARLLGWNLECDLVDSANCAVLDVLFGRSAGKWIVKGVQKQPLGLPLLYGRLFVEPEDKGFSESEQKDFDWTLLDTSDRARRFHLLSDFRFDYNFAKNCSEQQWEGCKGAAAKISNEGWGQGNARATPVGVAGMLARMAAAANGAKQQMYPHLVEHISDSEGKFFPLVVENLAKPEAITIDPALATMVLQGMTSHQQGGTAYSACKNVFADRCGHITWIAGKTGTPTFSFDQLTLQAIKKRCPYNNGKSAAGCNMIPYKWYVAAFKTKGDASSPFDKAIAVLTERNWSKRNDKVQSPGDQGVNTSAELAFRIIKALHTEVEKQPPVATIKKKEKS